MELFNNFIWNLHLREIYVSGVKFTWSNKQQNPTLVRLDRILATTSWDLHFSGCYAWTKARVGLITLPLSLTQGKKGKVDPATFTFRKNGFSWKGLGTWFIRNGLIN